MNPSRRRGEPVRNAGLLVDTDVLVEYLRGDPRAAAWLEERERPLHVSAISIAELFIGARTAEEDALRLFLTAFSSEPLTERIAETGGRLRRRYGSSHGTGLADALIAATALDADLALATFNGRHFPMISNLLVPYAR